MKQFFIGVLLLLCGIIIGCNQLAEFSVTEDIINQYLEKNIKYSKKIEIYGVANANLNLTNFSVKIGQIEPNKIIITTVAEINLKTLLSSTDAEVFFAITSLPYFDATTGAIYLKELIISDYKITPKKISSTIKSILPIINNLLKIYFDKNPIYLLQEEKNKVEWLTKKILKKLEVKPGKLIITLIK
ncbi:MAG: lipoprotein [Arsenophonus sp. ET-YP4-MAG3]